MLDCIIDFLPSPIDIPPVTGENEKGQSEERPPSDKAPFSALAFKIMTDPYVGQLTFLRVYSGVLNSGDTVYNAIKSKKERIGRILQMHANQREDIKEVYAETSQPRSGEGVTTVTTLCIPNGRDVWRMIFPSRFSRRGPNKAIRKGALR